MFGDSKNAVLGRDRNPLRRSAAAEPHVDKACILAAGDVVSADHLTGEIGLVARRYLRFGDLVRLDPDAANAVRSAAVRNRQSKRKVGVLVAGTRRLQRVQYAAALDLAEHDAVRILRAGGVALHALRGGAPWLFGEGFSRRANRQAGADRCKGRRKKGQTCAAGVRRSDDRCRDKNDASDRTNDAAHAPTLQAAIAFCSG